MRRLLRDPRVWAIIGALIIVVAIFQSTAAQRQSSRVANQARATANARAREAQVTNHGVCLRGNDARARIRQFMADTLQIIFGSTQLTPREQMLGRAIARRGLEILPNTKCDVVAPMPSHPTKAELAELPEPEPIPPLNR